MTLPVFETPRLTLRSITEFDAESLHEAYGDAEAMRHWDHPPSRDVSQTAERIRTSAEVDPRWHGMWAIQTHAGRLVGAINYHRTTTSNGDSRSGGSWSRRPGARAS